MEIIALAESPEANFPFDNNKWAGKSPGIYLVMVSSNLFAFYKVIGAVSN